MTVGFCSSGLDTTGLGHTHTHTQRSRLLPAQVALNPPRRRWRCRTGGDGRRRAARSASSPSASSYSRNSPFAPSSSSACYPCRRCHLSRCSWCWRGARRPPSPWPFSSTASSSPGPTPPWWRCSSSSTAAGRSSHPPRWDLRSASASRQGRGGCRGHLSRLVFPTPSTSRTRRRTPATCKGSCSWPSPARARPRNPGKTCTPSSWLLSSSPSSDSAVLISENLNRMHITLRVQNCVHKFGLALLLVKCDGVWRNDVLWWAIKGWRVGSSRLTSEMKPYLFSQRCMPCHPQMI